MDLLWQKEHLNWGYSTSILYKNWGVGDFNILIGGALDIKRIADSSVSPKWRLAFFRVNENGEFATENAFHGHGGAITDLSLEAPYVDQMFIEDTFEGTDWLFGTTSSINSVYSADRTYIWKFPIDPMTRLTL